PGRRRRYWSFLRTLAGWTTLHNEHWVSCRSSLPPSRYQMPKPWLRFQFITAPRNLCLASVMAAMPKHTGDKRRGRLDGDLQVQNRPNLLGGVLDGVLHIASGVMRGAFCLVHFTFRLKFFVIGHLACRILDRAFGFVRRA